MKVLILTCNTGGGHNSAAKALQSEWQQRGHICDIADALAFGPRHYSDAVSRLHTLGYRYFPHLYGYGYLHEERRSPKGHDSIEYKINKICVPRLQRFLQQGGYDVILTPHVFPAQMLTEIRRRQKTGWRFYFIATDYTCSPCVDEIRPDGWVIPDERLQAEFTSRGIPAEKIYPLGIPVAQRFCCPINKDDARRTLGLPAEGKLVLVMSGSIGCGPMEKLVKSLYRRLPKGTGIAVICANNRGMYRDMLRLSRHRRIYPVGYTDRMEYYLAAADTVITKPGGLSSTEIAQTGVPAVFLLSVPGCESRNLEFFTHYGLALGASSVRRAVRAAEVLLTSESSCQAMRQAQQTLPRNAVAAICDLAEQDVTSSQ